MTSPFCFKEQKKMRKKPSYGSSLIDHLKVFSLKQAGIIFNITSGIFTIK